jgi:death-on-curing protein
MSDDLHFLSVDDVLQIHADSMAEDGGSEGIIDIGLIESAVAMPRQQFGGQWLHPDIAAMAAAYLFHIASNHGFADGNKRTGAMASLVFLAGNDVAALPSPNDLERVTLAVAAGQMTKSEITDWMREVLGPHNRLAQFPESNA